MLRVLLFGDLDEAVGTGAYFKRIALFLSENYCLHISLRKSQNTMTMRHYLSNVRCTFSTHLSFWGTLERYAGKALSRLGVGLAYAHFRDTLLFSWLIRRIRPDLVFVSQGGGVNYFSVLLSRLPVVMVCHSQMTKPITGDTWGYSFLRLFRRMDKATKRLIHVSESGVSLFRRNIRSTDLAKASVVVHNFGVPVSVARKSCGRIVVLTMGHVVEYKNPIVWIEVARKLNARFPGILAWIWAGVGPMLDECREATEGDTGIEFVGFRRDVAGLYADCDIYFQPSIWENHSISIVEAMGAGIPCVVSSAGGSPESVRDGVDGFVCDPCSVDAYIDAFARLIKDPSLMQRMGESARERFASEFSREIWARKMKSVIASVTQE